jgi:glycosyltransferase involved in cell wall biosynthesis
MNKGKQGGIRLKGINKKPFMSVITVVFNSASFLEYTILSVIRQDFVDFEYIIIDGGSTDETIDLIKKHEDRIDFWISEPDKGIYDAMNKGVDLARGEWLNFMNAGDRFVNNSVLKDTFKQDLPNKTKFVFSDWFLCNLLENPEKLYPGYCNYEKGLVLHQSVIYKKCLHDEYGQYLVTPKLAISDYIFFYLIPESKIFKSEVPISINDNTGISSAEWSSQQRIAVDFILGKYSFSQYLRVLLKYLFIRFSIKILRLLPHFRAK